jgi:hypothetical protein
MRLFNKSKHEQRAVRSALTAFVICLTAIGLSACGGAASTRRTTATHSAAATPPSGGATTKAVGTWHATNPRGRGVPRGSSPPPARRRPCAQRMTSAPKGAC